MDRNLHKIVSSHIWCDVTSTSYLSTSNRRLKTKKLWKLWCGKGSTSEMTSPLMWRHLYTVYSLPLYKQLVPHQRWRHLMWRHLYSLPLYKKPISLQMIDGEASDDPRVPALVRMPCGGAQLSMHVRRARDEQRGVRDPGTSVERRGERERRQPEPEKDEDLLVEQVDGQGALHCVTMNVWSLEHKWTKRTNQRNEGILCYLTLCNQDIIHYYSITQAQRRS